MAETDTEFRDALIESYGTREALADELRERIDEVLEVRKELEREREKRAPRALQQRIRELERDLATVNARVSHGADAEMMLRKLAYAHRQGHPIPDDWWPTIERIGGRNANPLRSVPSDGNGTP